MSFIGRKGKEAEGAAYIPIHSHSSNYEYMPIPSLGPWAQGERQRRRKRRENIIQRGTYLSLHSYSLGSLEMHCEGEERKLTFSHFDHRLLSSFLSPWTSKSNKCPWNLSILYIGMYVHILEGRKRRYSTDNQNHILKLSTLFNSSQECLCTQLCPPFLAPDQISSLSTPCFNFLHKYLQAYYFPTIALSL